MYRSKRKRNMIIFSLVGVLLCMVVGYAAFQTKLEIKGSSKVTSNWDIRITNVTDGTSTGGAENTVKPSWTNLTASMEANLYDKGDAMEYDVTIENKGTLDAKLNDILTNIEKENNEAVLITFTGYTKGEVLKAGGSKIVHVKIEYNPEYEGGETSSEVEINFDYGQDNKSEDVPKTYLLTYDYKTNGGNRVDSEGEYLTSGSNVDLSNIAYKEGYRFVGWNTDKNAEVGLTSLQMKAEALTLYAIYSKDLKVIYEKGENIESIGKNEDACTIYNNETSCEITLPSITPNEGYVIDGWYNGNNKVGNTNDKYSLKSNTTLTSKVKQNAYTVTYDYKTNGGTSSTKETDKVNYGEAIDLTPTATKSGWTFVGWNTNKDATTGLTSLKMNNSNVTLYAIYNKKVTATFNANGATIGSTSQSCYRYNGASSCNVATPSITRSGFTITGWGTSASTTNAVVKANASLSLTANKTYYAVTSKVVTVTYSKGSNVSSIGSTSATCTIRNSATNCSVTLPSITASSTYIADGWYSGSTKVGSAGAKYTVSNNTTLTAQAKADNITLSMSTTNTTNSITVVANATADSGIVKYEFSKDGGKTWINGGTSKTYTFNGLTQGTAYNIQVRVTANSGKTASTSKTVTTSSLTKPTFSEEGTTNKTVTITYPSSCGNTLTCTYQKDNGNVVNVTSTTAKVTFTADGNLVATVSDGTNSVSSSYTVQLERALNIGTVRGGSITLDKNSALLSESVNITASPTTDFTYQGATLVCEDGTTKEIAGTEFNMSECNNNLTVYPTWKKNELVLFYDDYSIPFQHVQWEGNLYDGYIMTIDKSVNTFILFSSVSSNNARAQVTTTTSLDLTDYDYFRVGVACFKGSHDTTIYLGTVKERNRWAHEDGQAMTVPHEDGRIQNTEIKNLNDNYYLAVEVLTNSQVDDCYFNQAKLLGTTYSYANPGI